MGKEQINTSTPTMSRRTGIDRRWIASPGHHPERRSGKDRRLTHHRSFLEPIDSNDQSSPNHLLFNVHPGIGAIDMQKPEGENPEKSLFQMPETALADGGNDK